VSTNLDVRKVMLYIGAQILAEHGEGLRERELRPLIRERLPARGAREDSGRTPEEKGFLFDTIRLVKAGWLHKDTQHVWHLTGPGRKVLARNDDYLSFWQEAVSAYQFWERNQARFDRLARLVGAIPEGSWAADSDLAAQTGLSVDSVVHWLLGERPPGWHLVLDPDGGLPDAANLSEEERAGWLRRLTEDGLAMPGGRAEAYSRVPGEDLRQLEVGDLAGEPETGGRRAWLIRGSSVQGENLVRNLWLPEGKCSLAASRLRSLAAGVDRQTVKEAVDEGYRHASAHERARLTGEYHAFLSVMRVDDIVLTNDGTRIYAGVLEGPPEFVASHGSRANLVRTVRWSNAHRPLDYTDLPAEISARLSNPDADLIDLTDFLGDLETLVGEEEVSEPVTQRPLQLPDATEELADALLLPREWLQECVELLRDRPQLIFYGPPGTGKTYVAQALASHLAESKPENVQLIQFHPGYSYEDFFEGYRPQRSPDGGVAFELKWGPFRQLVEAARAHSGEAYVLIIDEINRANLAKVFGELYFLLEYRSKSVNLLYGAVDDAPFTLPGNVVILGTMNTADRSIALVDVALRRRFWFQELHPEQPPVQDLLERWLAARGYPGNAARLLQELNGRIEDHDFKIGPSYLMRELAQEPGGLERIWRGQILPLLEEHHYGQLGRAQVQERYGLDALRRVLGTA
jgi:5-methylcytosine-specific restriction enzyme B